MTHAHIKGLSVSSPPHAEGYEDRNKIIEGALFRQMPDELGDYASMERLNLLANLIADGILDIRIAYTDNNRNIGMYHEKMGIIEDAEGNKVAFSGSMNETLTGMSINYETIDVFCSWKNGEGDRVALKENAFSSMWNNTEPNLKVIRFQNVTDALIEKYKRKAPDFDIDREEFDIKELSGDKDSDAADEDSDAAGARVPRDVVLHDYQKQAIDAWVKEDYRGIFDMATGTGKTYTGLGAISRISKDLDDDLAVIIVVPYQHLVSQWVEDIERFNMKPIIAFSSSPQKDWKKRLAQAVRDERIYRDHRFLCLICTNATFANSAVQGQIDKIRDEEGTELLHKFFGNKCIEYGLERAIEENKLTPYKYYPVLVYLNESELMSYEDLSFEISKCVIFDELGRPKLNRQGELLAIKRSRLVAGAIQKLAALKREIEPYKNESNILVYCGATTIADSDDDSDDESDIRQIEAVTKILGNELGMSVARFTSEESAEERASIKEHFQNGNGLQAIVAIKCLDEGVNIPGIRTAFILASTTNPKEYIQRRGRVLRKAPNKEFAEIYDFVTLPRPLDTVPGLTLDQAERDKTLVKKELRRIKEFGSLAMNSMQARELMLEIEDVYHIADREIERQGSDVE